MSKHAKLSASGSERWILCPGSVKAEEGIPEKHNSYAAEGTLAHEIAANILNGALWEELEVAVPEMVLNVTKYVEYIKSIESETILIEQKVDFSHIVPDGFGTADCIIKNGNTIHVIDLKYGKGIPVYSENNTQLLLYAIGAVSIFQNYKPETIIMHIVQPRISNYSKWEITFSELLNWMAFLHEKALLALKPDAIRIPHQDACRWCKAKPTCPAIYDFINYNILPLKEKKVLTNDELKLILDNSNLITNFLASVVELVYEKLLTGEEINGYKLVEGRSVRKIRTDGLNESEKSLLNSLYKKVPMTLTEIEKMLGKDIVDKLTYKQSGKPILVNSTDKRKSIWENYKFNDVNL